MIIKPREKGDVIKDAKLYCTMCGKKVSFEKKYLTHYCQQKIRNNKVWIVFLGYICPFCGTISNTVINYNKNQYKIIKKINLYNNYLPKANNGETVIKA